MSFARVTGGGRSRSRLFSHCGMDDKLRHRQLWLGDLRIIISIILGPLCLIRAKRRVTHKRAIIVQIIYALEKTIYGMKKTIYGLKRLFTDQKRLLTAWGYFCRIVSLFSITWRTFNQSMNKNTWMPYIIDLITCPGGSRHCSHILAFFVFISMHWVSLCI